jgi:hypothetical protein
MMFLINKQTKKATPLIKRTFSELSLTERHDLQEWITDCPSILGEELLIIQKEFDGFFDTNERLDLLALDENGKLVIIENKLDDSGRDVVWQSLKYVSYCAILSKTDICQIYQRFLGNTADAEKNLAEFFETDYDSIMLNPSDGDQRIILVAANFRKEVTSTVLWLLGHNVDIKCVKITPYEDEDKLYLDVEQILPVQDAGDYQIRLNAKKQDELVLQKDEAVRHKARRAFWEFALPVLREKSGIYNNVSPTKDNSIAGASGHSGISYNSVILMNDARAEIYIDVGDKEKNKHIYRYFLEKKIEIENSFDKDLSWEELPDKRGARISISFGEFGLNDNEHWTEISDFLGTNVAKLKTAFGKYISGALEPL